MAQAVAAQALSRAGALAANSTFTAAAAKAYAAVPVALVQQLAEGPWIKLYSFDRLVVLKEPRHLARRLTQPPRTGKPAITEHRRPAAASPAGSRGRFRRRP